jgi:hypothetical protein
MLPSKSEIRASTDHYLDRIDMRVAVIREITRANAEEQLGLKGSVAVHDQAADDPSLCRVHRDPVVRGVTEI